MRYNLLAFALLWSALPAQVVRLANHSPTAFTGWQRVTVDITPPFTAGDIGTASYVVGRRTGLDTQAVDIKVTLAPGERMTLDLAQSIEADFVLAPPRGKAWTGGGLLLNNRPMQWVSAQADGAAWLLHLQGRPSRMMHTDIWLRAYPGENYVRGEALTIASNGSLPDLHADAEQQRLSFGDSVVIGSGRQFWQPLFDSARFADGQGRAVPFTLLWLRHTNTAEQWSSAQAVMANGIGGIGIAKLHPDGNPALPTDTNPVTWARQYLPGAMSAIHDWSAPVASIAANSTQTGSQYDQLFRHGEPLLPNGTGAEWVSYLCALKYSNRPCHHLEASGLRINPSDHPNCIFWQSRPHPHPNVGSDKLAKEGQQPLAPWDIPGQFFGSDREHWLIGTLCAGARYTGSPALQVLLEHQANAFLLGETVRPGWSTSHSDAARSVGYAGLVAVQLWNTLEDRDLAAQVRERWRQRVLQVYIPELSGKPAGIWDPRADGRILGDLDKDRTPKLYAQGTMMWQQSLGAWGLDYGCRHLGPSEGRVLALRAAKAVLAHAWRKRGGRWLFFDNVGYRGGEPLPESEYEEGKGVHRTGWFDGTWAVPGVAAILRHEPENAQALEIWAQITEGGGSWVPPGPR